MLIILVGSFYVLQLNSILHVDHVCHLVNVHVLKHFCSLVKRKQLAKFKRHTYFNKKETKKDCMQQQDIAAAAEQKHKQ